MFSDQGSASAAEEPRDTTRRWWLAVLALFVLLCGAMFLMPKPRPLTSQVWASHILIQCDTTNPLERDRAIERLTEIRNRVLAGESFEKLAREYSDDPYSAPRGGDLGPAKKGTYVGAFENYVWAGEIGAISDIVSTEHGLHLIRIDRRELSAVDAHLEEQKRLQESQQESQ